MTERPTDALLRLAMAGTCGSDLRAYQPSLSGFADRGKIDKLAETPLG